MPTITSIKPQKNQKRVNIYLDGKFGFGLDLETLITLNLKEGTELTAKEIEEIVNKAEFQKVYDKILKFGALRPRSEKEYLNWLEKHKVHKSLHEELFKRLARIDFLNDKKFATWWVEQRQTFRPRSKRIMIYELRIKGVDKKIIDEVLSEFKIDETEAAKKVLEKKKYKWKDLDDYEARIKMSYFLARRGFDWEIIKEVVGETVDQ